WTHAATLLLIEQVRINQEQFHKPGQKKRVWDKIAFNIQEVGYSFVNSLICDKKWRNLKRTYKTVSGNNNKTGRGKKSWEYFDVMHGILGRDPAITPVAVFQMMLLQQKTQPSAAVASLEPQAGPSVSTPSSASPNTPPKSKRRTSQSSPPSWFKKFANERKEDSNEKFNKLIEIDNKQLEILNERNNLLRDFTNILKENLRK
ncbi:hypothetical protein HHUSO_G22372, partial [Huso huso]